MRTVFIAVVVFASGVASAGQPVPKRHVNLDAPGSMEAVERENPVHYAKIQEIIRVSQSEPCETLPRILKARIDVDQVNCSSYLLLTSYPPKKHMTFTIDNVGYTTNAVQYKIAGGKLMPAR